MLGIAVKYVSRNDQYAKFRKEDIAIGLELALTGCLMFVVLTTDRAAQLVILNGQIGGLLASASKNQAVLQSLQAKSALMFNRIATSGWPLLAMFLGLWGLSTIVRKWGWKSATEMRPIVGIALPLVFGILVIASVMTSAAL